MKKWIAQLLMFSCLISVKHNLYAQPMDRATLHELLALDGRNNIMKEENFGIANGYITHRVHYNTLGKISGLFAPPYASSNFLLETRMFGEEIRSKHYRWLPYQVESEGEIQGVEVRANITLLSRSRRVLISYALRNTRAEAVKIPVQFAVAGGLDYIEKWEFQRPTTKTSLQVEVDGSSMTGSNKFGRILIQTDIPNMHWFALGARWDGKIELDAGKEAKFHLVIEMGADQPNHQQLAAILAQPEQAVNATREEYIDRVEELLTKLPRFRSDNKMLEQYYYRSLAVLLTNKWIVPEFALQPYYGSGGVIGGCLGNYLWEFGLPAQLFPLVDPQASKSHIKQFLQIDITRHYLFNPMDGKAGGVWYQVNQDKIIELIYYYVLHTGDVQILREQVDGKTVYDHVISNALFGDDLNTPAKLVDYGDEGENHLELRRGYPYRGIMPDVNGLRYLTYLRAYELTRLAGKPVKELPTRAESLKKLLKQELWSPEHQWFFFESKGKKDIRMTNFMYTLIGTGVFDRELEKGLLSHLNEKEFLGDFGIHSISKLDPAYDQIDIDHGGGGSYVAFPPIICQRLYNAGYREAADNLLKRHLWWGQRLPYWGDSKVANFMGYREDTPLQSDFSAISGAQTILFGLFGISMQADGKLTIDPVLPSLCSEMKLEGLKLRGKQIDIETNANGYTVKIDGKVQQTKKGQPLVVKIK